MLTLRQVFIIVALAIVGGVLLWFIIRYFLVQVGGVSCHKVLARSAGDIITTHNKTRSSRDSLADSSLRLAGIDGKSDKT